MLFAAANSLDAVTDTGVTISARTTEFEQRSKTHPIGTMQILRIGQILTAEDSHEQSDKRKKAPEILRGTHRPNRASPRGKFLAPLRKSISGVTLLAIVDELGRAFDSMSMKTYNPCR